MNSLLFVGTIYSKVATVLKVGIYLHVPDVQESHT